MTRRRPTRAAFTLIELLVVISIIGILMGLALPAVQKIRGGGPRTQARTDITQIEAACTEFHGKYKFFPPTQFAIPTRIDQPGFTEVFKRMFPRWNPPLMADNVTIQPASRPAGAGTTLTGNASMVYFLGGPSGTGWAVDAPVAPSATATSKNVFMDFPEPPSRRANGSGPGKTFLDPWGQPYAYHGSIAGGAYPNVSANGVFPFQRSGKFENAGKVQIISAGENKTFGPGGAWTPGTAPYATGAAGGDDMANFNEGKLLGVQ